MHRNGKTVGSSAQPAQPAQPAQLEEKLKVFARPQQFTPPDLSPYQQSQLPQINEQCLFNNEDLLRKLATGQGRPDIMHGYDTFDLFKPLNLERRVTLRESSEPKPPHHPGTPGANNGFQMT